MYSPRENASKRPCISAREWCFMTFSSRGPKITSSFSSASAAALTALLSERSLKRRTLSEGALLATHLIEYGYDIRTVPEAFRFVATMIYTHVL